MAHQIVPGALGLTWMVVRGEWREALRALSWTGAICFVSFALWPSAWLDWAGFLHHFGGTGQAHLRAVAAVILVAVGAHRGWWWTIPVALVIGAPVVADGAWLYALMYLTALPRLKKAHAEGTSETRVRAPRVASVVLERTA